MPKKREPPPEAGDQSDVGNSRRAASSESDGRSSANEVIASWLDRDLTAAAAAGQLQPAFYMDDVLDQVADLLSAGRHPILVGDPGVGKTAVIHELLRRAAAGVGPEVLRGKRVLQFSLRRRACSLKANEGMGGPMQELIEALLQSNGQIIPYFRDIHLCYRFDLESHLQSLAFGLQVPILAEGDRLTVQSMMESAPDLEQLFILVSLSEPDLPRMQRILSAWAEDQRERQGKNFTREAMSQALYLSHRFLSRSCLPRKVLDLLSQAGVMTRGHAPVAESGVIDRFSLNHRVPRVLIDPAMRLDLLALSREFSEKVLGQVEAVQAVINMIGLIKAGLSDVRRPFGVFFFVGPTGVGKTHLAQLLAEFLFGSRDRMIRLNMTDFQEEPKAEVLFGNPHDHRPSHVRGMLTQRVQGQPIAVLLLDEFEKAHQSIHDRFLQLMDEGLFINGAGEAVSCRSMIIIATSNAGAEVYRGHAFGFTGQMDMAQKDRELKRRLEQRFRFEFLNRFDQIVHFHPLSREDIRTIALRELEQLKERAGLQQRGLGLEVDEAVLDWLTAHGYDPDYGARFLRRAIERHVATALATTIVRDGPAAGSRIGLSVRHNQIVAMILDEPQLLLSGRSGTEEVSLPGPLGTDEQVMTLSEERLREQVGGLLLSADRKLHTLRQREQERSTLLDQMNRPGFWEQAPDRQEVLGRFRELDVLIQVETRLSEPILHLREQADRHTQTLRPEERRALAHSLEEAAAALREWDNRLAEEGPGAVWLVIANADPLRPAGQWIEDLATMELGFCQRLHLSAQVVGCVQSDEELSRVVLEVEGPGAAAFLAMEEGQHRLHRTQGTSLRAHIELLEKGDGSPGPWPHLRPSKGRTGPLGLLIDSRARLELKERGLVLEVYGKGGEAFSHLMWDLHHAWQAPQQQPTVARIYGEDGTGARDPRTGAVMPRLKDVLKGRLDRFVTAWRQQMN